MTIDTSDMTRLATEKRVKVSWQVLDWEMLSDLGARWEQTTRSSTNRHAASA